MAEATKAATTDEAPKHPGIEAAFLAAQRVMENPKKSHEATVPIKAGGSYKYKYASLDDTMLAAKTALNGQGISLRQPMICGDGVVGIKTLLTHPDSGEQMDLGELFMADPGDPQKLGGILTYLRRYALGACGLVAEEDTDAGGVGAGATTAQAQQAARASGTSTGKGSDAKPISEAQNKLIMVLMKKAGGTPEKLKATIQDVTGKASSKDMTTKDASVVIERIQAIGRGDALWMEPEAADGTTAADPSVLTEEDKTHEAFLAAEAAARRAASGGPDQDGDHEPQAADDQPPY